MTYTVTDADGDTAELSFVLTVTGDSTEAEGIPEYEPLRAWTVSDGRVTFSLLGSGECLAVSDLTLFGVDFTVHTSKWQRRASENSPWSDIPGTAHTGGVCAYSPTEAGQYRGVAEISIDGTIGNYSSGNVLTVS